MNNNLFIVTCQSGGKLHFSKSPYNKTLCGLKYEYIGSDLDLNDSEEVEIFTKNSKHLACKKCWLNALKTTLPYA